MAAEYVSRAARYVPCTVEQFVSEEALLGWLDTRTGRTTATLIVFDRMGKPLASEEFAAQLRRLRDAGAQMVVLAIGPADGWSAKARARADLLISFGPITLPHELARVVLAEQIYRALTTLRGHPYPR